MGHPELHFKTRSRDTSARRVKSSGHSNDDNGSVGAMTKRTWIGAAVLAACSAAATYYLDPNNGKARRIRVVERSGHLLRTARRRLVRESRYAFHTLMARARHLAAHEPPGFADGRTLLDRVESELFRDRSIPHGRLNLEVEGTTVILRGQLDDG